MRLPKAEQAKLLQLQEAELQALRLKHQIETDPLKEKLKELSGRAEDLRRSVIAQKVDLEERRRKIAEAEVEVDKVEARRRVQQERLDSGKLPLRDMNPVEHEIRKIVERKEQLELQVMELEEDYETRQRFLADTEKQAQALAADNQRTQDQLAVQLSAPTEKLGVQEELVRELRDALPGHVLDEYDHQKGRLGAVAVLRFEDGRLVDAPVELSAEELSALRRAPEDELWESEETGYLIVRV